MLNREEQERYGRQILLPQIGLAGQEKIRAARVLVIGAGGLGCPILQYLTAAGVGRIGIADFDKVELSNLQRQILFGTADVGLFKADVAARKLQQLNPNPEIIPHVLRIGQQNILELFSGYDIIADATDNFPARYLISDTCDLLKKPLVFGSMYRFEGQVSVFAKRGKNGEEPFSLRDLFPEQPEGDLQCSCAAAGVIGVLPGIIGALQANEIIKLITGAGELLNGKLLITDLLTVQQQIVSIQRNETHSGRPQSTEELLNWDYSGNKQNKSTDEKIFFPSADPVSA